jgi:hypothetical protein
MSIHTATECRDGQAAADRVQGQGCRYSTRLQDMRSMGARHRRNALTSRLLQLRNLTVLVPLFISIPSR